MNVLVVVLLLMLAVPSGAAAGAVAPGPDTGPVDSGHVTATLVAGADRIAPGGVAWLGVDFRLDPGWHIYWRNPGDSGLPPDLRWTLPPGVTADAPLFPSPERIPVGPLMNFGYHDQVLLPVQLTVAAGAALGPLRVVLNGEWLVCAEICVPESARLALTLTVAGAAETEVAAPALTAARAAIPEPVAWPARFVHEGGRIDLSLALPAAQAGSLRPIAFFPYGETAIEHAARQDFQRTADGVRLSLPAGSQVEHLDGVWVFGTDDPNRRRAVEVRPVRVAARSELPSATGPVAAQGSADQGAEPPGDPGGAGGGLWVALGFALAGGLLLNLMPCVFPILFLKGLGFVAAARSRPGLVRLQGLAFTAGVLASFGAVAGLLLVLLAGGAEIGWGYQLQSPEVVAGLALLFFAIGLNLSGVFPFGHGWTGLGSGLAGRDGLGGAFWTGVLATVVATPCTAPFMGAATGFALTQPAPAALAVFLALGLGMALPYLSLSFSPLLQRCLPRPGVWMERVKQGLAFPMYATAAWLAWVVGVQSGPDGMLAVLVGATGLGFALWLYGVTRDAAAGWRRVGIAAAVLGVGLAVGLVLVRLPVAVPSAVGAPASTGGLAAEPFAPARLAALRAEGRPVFVNFTAAWCITCLVNERVALSGTALAQHFAETGVVYLKGDWTRRDPEITAALREFGRSGVPLYLYYPPDGKEPVVLPQLLTEGMVLAAVGG